MLGVYVVTFVRSVTDHNWHLNHSPLKMPQGTLLSQYRVIFCIWIGNWWSFPRISGADVQLNLLSGQRAGICCLIPYFGWGCQRQESKLPPFVCASGCVSASKVGRLLHEDQLKDDVCIARQRKETWKDRWYTIESSFLRFIDELTNRSKGYMVRTCPAVRAGTWSFQYTGKEKRKCQFKGVPFSLLGGTMSTAHVTWLVPKFLCGVQTVVQTFLMDKRSCTFLASILFVLVTEHSYTSISISIYT